MADLRSALEAAVAEHTETDPVKIVTAPVETSIESSDGRNDKGRFAAKEKEDAAPIEIGAEAAVKRPTSWKKEFWETFDKVDPTLRNPMEKYIAEREDQFHKGLEGYKSKAQQADEFNQAITPYMEDIRAVGLTPASAAKGLFDVDRVLRHGGQAEKLQMLNKIITDYHIDLNQPAQPAYQAPVADVVDQRVKAILAEQQINTQLNDFLKNPPEYFNAVRDTMSQILGAGMADSYQAAYDKAVRLHPDIAASIQTKQTADTIAAQRLEADKAAKAAKAKAVSVKGSSTGSKAVSSGTDRRALIAEALRESQSRI